MRWLRPSRLRRPAWLPGTAHRAAGRRLRRFAAGHGGAVAMLEPVGRSGLRLVLVGGDGRWGDLMVPDAGTAERLCAPAGVPIRPGRPGELRAAMRETDRDRRRMGSR